MAILQSTEVSGSLSISGSLTAQSFVGDGSSITGVIAETPAGTVSGSAQVVALLGSHSGNVGIGTASPTHILDITTNRTGNGQGSTLRINRPNNSSYENAINWATGGTNKWFLGSDNDSTENFYLYNWAQGSFALTVQSSNNNVGIGTTSPNAVLEIEDGGTSNTQIVKITADDANPYGLVIGNDTFTTTDYEGLGFIVSNDGIGTIDARGTNTQFRIRTGATPTERLRINTSGSVGIGTTTVEKTFTVEFSNEDTTVTTGNGLAGGAEGDGVKIQNNSTTSGTYANLDFRANNADGRIAYKYMGTTNVGDFHFITDNLNSPISAMIIKNDGKVSIGGATPSAKLHVKGEGGVSGLTFKTTDASDNETFFILDGGRTGVRYYPLTVGIPSSTAAATNAVFQVEEAGLLTVLTGGNVGIGTTSPDSKLHIVDGNNYIKIGDLNGVSTAVIELSDSSPVQIEGYSSDLRFNTNGSPRMTINNAGNVGIGETSVDARLHVTALASSGISNIKLESPGASKWAFGIPASQTYLAFDETNDNLSTPTMVLTKTTKRVGIGTTSPAALLQIDTPSANNAGQGLRLNRPAAGTHYNSVEFATNGTVDWSIGQNSNDAFEVYENGAGATTRFTIKEGGNVGIGTTSPGAKLHVDGDVIRTVNSTWSGIESHNTNGTWESFVGTESGGGGNRYNAASSQHTFYNNSSAVMRINSSGNVGIGTTSPSATLHLSDASNSSVTTFSANGRITMRGDGVLAWGASANQAHLTWATGYAIVHALSGQKLYLGAGGSTDNIVIDTSGNVGIGTTSPSRTLHVDGGSGVAARFETTSDSTIELVSTNSWVGINFNDSSSTNENIWYNGGQGTFAIGGGGSNVSGKKLHIDGGVSIGSNSDALSVPTDGLYVEGDLTVGGIVTAQEFHTEFVSASIVYSSGSTKFGDTSDDVHAFTGSINLFNPTSTTGTTGTTLQTLTNYVGSDLSQQKTFIDFIFKDDNANYTPQVRIGAEVGENGDANAISKESSGAFIVYTSEGTDEVGSGTISEKFRVDYKGNVGIGTTSPDTKTHISHTTRINDAYGLLLVENTNTTSGNSATNSGINVKNYHGTSQFMQWEDNGVRIGSRITANSGLGNVYFTGGSDSVKMFINGSNGNVGIGTTSPDSKLHVSSGDIRITNNSPSIYFYDSDVSGLYHRILGGGNKGLEYSVDPNNATAGYHRWDIGGTVVAQLIEGGNFGLGTTTPSYKLTINTSDEDHIRLENGSEVGVIQLLDNGILNFWSHGDDANNEITFSNGTGSGTERMRIDSSGNVGIGTSSPGLKLDVNGDIRLLGTGTGNNSHILYFTNSAAAIARDANNLELHAYDNLIFGVSNTAYPTSTERMRIDSSGNVGIGTTSPDSNLHVFKGSAGTVAALSNSIITAEYSANGYISVLVPDANESGILFGRPTSNVDGGIIYNNSSTSRGLQFRTAGNDTKMVINSSGNVGIGTTSPGGKLDVAGNIEATDQISVNNRTAISVAHWSNSASSSTGAVKIQIPGTHSSNWSMLVLRITTYEYNSTAGTVYYVSGHDWTSGWYNTGVIKIGTSNKDVSLGYDSNYDYVIVGGTSSTWNYGHVTVDVMAHPSFYSGNMDITTGWSISQVTSLSGITVQSVTNKRVLTTSDEGSGNGIDADTVDGIQAASFLRSDASDTATGNIRIENGNNIPLSVTGSNATYTSILVGNSGTGAATLWLDGSNGDLVGGDYAAVRQTNDKHLQLEVGSNGGDIIFTESGAETMRLKDGNVGIGTTSTDATFTVSSGTANNVANFKSTDGTAYIAIADNSSTNALHNQIGVVGDNMYFATNDTERMRIDSSGQAWFKSSNDYKIGLNDSAGVNQWWLKSYTNGDFAIHENGVGDKFTIQAGGNVGIGNTSPSVKFQVVGTGLQGVQGWFGNGFINSANYHYDFARVGFSVEATDGTDTGAGFHFNTRNSGNSNWLHGYIYQPQNGGIAFGTGGAGTTQASERMRINNIGDVGIGTTSPTSKLHIEGAGKFYSTIGDADNVRTGLAHYDNSSMGSHVGGQIVLGYKYKTDGSYTEGAILKMYKENGTSGQYGSGLKFQVRNHGANLSTKMILDPSGNLGIGTTSPAALLHINGAGDAIRVESTNTGVGGAQMDLIHYTTSPADNDVHGSINFGGYYSGTNSAYGSSIKSIWTDVSAREGQLEFYTRDDAEFAARMAIDKDGNVGIGTTSPQAKLHVEGGRSFFFSGDAYSVAIAQTVGQANYAYLGTDTSGNFNIYETGGTSRFTVQQGGNVGIGNTSPASILNTSGANQGITHDDSTTGKGYIRFRNGGTQLALFGIAGSWEGSSLQDTMIAAETGHNIRFYTNGTATPKMFISDSGNVGIGTTSPGRKLHLVNGQIKFENTSTGGWTGLDFAVGNGTYDGYMGMLDNDGRFFIDVDSNGEDFTILQNGNVGIGTTTPATKLDVNGTSTFREAMTIIQNADALILKKASNVRNSIVFQNSSGTDLAEISVHDTGNNNRFYIYDNVLGNYLLYSDSNSGDIFVPNGDFTAVGNSRAIKVQNSSGNTAVQLLSDSSGDGQLRLNDSSGNTRVFLYAEGNGDAYINTGGNVGIGTTSPSEDLHIVTGTNTSTGIRVDTGLDNGSASTPSALDLRNIGGSVSDAVAATFNVGSADRAKIIGGRYSNGGYLQIQTGNSSNTLTDRVRIDNSGNVGIGTTSPTATLQVEGSGSTVFDVQGSQGQLFSVTDDLTGTLFSVNDISGIPILSVDSDDTVTMGTFGENTLVVTGSNVGIGTTSPSKKLDVRGEVALDVMADYQTEGEIRIGRSDGTSRFHTIRAYNDSTAANNYLFFDVHNGTVGANVNVLALKGNGNVGIGITSPTSKLHVQGSATPGTYAAYIHNASGGGNVLKLYNHDWDTGDYLLYATNGGTTAYGYGFTVDGNGRVNIGLASVATANAAADDLHLKSLGSNGITISSGNAQTGTIFFGDSTDSAAAGFRYNHNTGDMAISAEDNITITADNVGIGTTSPAHKLDVIGTVRAGNSYRASLDGNSGGAQIYFGSASDIDSLGTIGTYSSLFNIDSSNGPISFKYGGSEKMRIMDNGNVGIGTTSPDELLHVAKSSGDTIVAIEANAGNAALYLTSAGSGKDNRIVTGNGKDLKFETQVAGSGQGQGQDPISTGTTIMTLHSDGDLTLAGSIKFNGDTAAANALDDYEEGTWTPVYGSSVATVSSVTYDTGVRFGRYTKVGNMVTAWGRIRTDFINWSSTSGAVYVGGFPYTPATILSAGTVTFSAAISRADSWAGDDPWFAGLVSGQDRMYLYYKTSFSGTTSNITPADMSDSANNNDLCFSISYRV